MKLVCSAATLEGGKALDWNDVDPGVPESLIDASLTVKFLVD